MSLIDGPTTPASGSDKPKKVTAPKDVYPYKLAPGYLFSIELNGNEIAIFSECSGLGARRAVETVAEGGVNDYKHKLPGQFEYDHITLKRGLSMSVLLWKWFESGKYNFAVVHQTVSIVQLAPGITDASKGGTPLTGGFGKVAKWSLNRAFPVSWKMSELSVNNTDSIAVETLELAHEGITLD